MSSGLLQTLEGIYNIGRHFLDYGIIVLMVYYILKFMRGTRAASEYTLRHSDRSPKAALSRFRAAEPPAPFQCRRCPAAST